MQADSPREMAGGKTARSIRPKPSKDIMSDESALHGPLSAAPKLPTPPNLVGRRIAADAHDVTANPVAPSKVSATMHQP